MRAGLFHSSVGASVFAWGFCWGISADFPSAHDFLRKSTKITKTNALFTACYMFLLNHVFLVDKPEINAMIFKAHRGKRNDTNLYRSYPKTEDWWIGDVFTQFRDESP